MAQDHGEDDYKQASSQHEPIGLTTRYQSTMAITDATTISRQPGTRNMKYNSARQIDSNSSRILPASQLSSHKDILMPNISKQFTVQRVYKPARGPGRHTALGAYQSNQDAFDAANLLRQSHSNDYQDAFGAADAKAKDQTLARSCLLYTSDAADE